MADWLRGGGLSVVTLRHMAGRKHRPHLKPTRPPALPVVVVKPGVNTLVPPLRREVLRRAKGDVSRIEVLSPTEAVVR